MQALKNKLQDLKTQLEKKEISKTEYKTEYYITYKKLVEFK
jgi:hypothetical protein